jgi:tRNA(adenine34) deaminase
MGATDLQMGGAAMASEDPQAAARAGLDHGSDHEHGHEPAHGLDHPDEHWMRLALEEAARAAEEGEVPIGAVVTCDGELVAAAHNRREGDADPAAHAEFLAMELAARRLGRWRLTGCTVYVTLEPCLMCAGLMVNSRVDRCVFGAADPKGGAVGTLYDVSHDPRLNHEFEVSGGVLADECADVLREFFRARRRRR